MAKIKGKSKKELLIEQIAVAVGAGREVAVETVDFSDPNRPKTCLEVDFPIIPINQIAQPEMSSGAAKKPIYAWQKWWARRSSAVFRGILVAAAMKAPTDESKAAKAVWDVYYANHQKRGSLRHLTVIDPFMGGGTTIVEGSRLGMQMFGCDLNPVAWFIVKNEMAQVNIEEVSRLLAAIEAEVKPQIMPYYACDGPNGEKGIWFRKTGGVEVELPSNFDIFSVSWQERKHYRYEGPEIIYTFWTKHGPCQREGCGHRTPIKFTPIAATKILTVNVWPDWECFDCVKTFDVERHAARMAPEVPLFVAPNEKIFVVMDDNGGFQCPHCGKQYEDKRGKVVGNSINLGKAKNKKVELTLLIHPQWLEGCPKHDDDDREYGGSATDSVDATIRWNNARGDKLRLVEVRGQLPEEVTCPETGTVFCPDKRGGTVTKPGYFKCQAPTCGKEQPNSESFAVSGKTASISTSLIQGYSSTRDYNGYPYSGRFFNAPRNSQAINAACAEWEVRKDTDLRGYWPSAEIPFGHMTHQRQPLPDHGYTHWWKMFNPIQLILHSLICRTIVTNEGNYSRSALDAVLGIWHRYMQHENMLCFWDEKQDCVAPSLANNNFHPKNTVVQSNPFSKLGRGNWTSSVKTCMEALLWERNPWDLVSASQCGGFTFSSKTAKVPCGDAIPGGNVSLRLASATELDFLKAESIDLVITDPPFGGLLHYSELADFFYVWLRLALQRTYPEAFVPEYCPKSLEAVSNVARNPEDADAFYQRILTNSWHESFRVLKPGGILAFTFHHSEDDPWIGVLESLFDAGFYLEATYPIRSDETKGEGEFGSKQIEFDIIHVCRKRMVVPLPISWARLRRLIVDDVRHLKFLLEQHRKDGLPAADLDIIKRGKALEYFSRHYGKVFIEKGREFTIKDALPAIKLLVDEESDSASGTEPLPAVAEPYTRQFFRIFYETCQIPRDQMQKFLRGTGIAPSDFQERGWCKEKKKVFTLTPPVELAQAWKGAPRKGMARDFDQTMFLVGGCFEGSNIRVTDTLDSPNFAPHPATEELVAWLARHGGSQEIRWAAQRAGTIYRDWLAKNKPKLVEQLKLFDLES